MEKFKIIHVTHSHEFGSSSYFDVVYDKDVDSFDLDAFVKKHKIDVDQNGIDSYKEFINYEIMELPEGFKIVKDYPDQKSDPENNPIINGIFN